MRSWTHGPFSEQQSQQFKTEALTDRLPVAHLGSNSREAGREKYALTCQSYSTKLSSHTEAPFFLANPFLSFSRQLMPIFPVALHISSNCASYQMRDNWEMKPNEQPRVARGDLRGEATVTNEKEEL